MNTSLICLVRQALGLQLTDAGRSVSEQVRHEGRTVQVLDAADLRQVSAGTDAPPPPLPRGGW